MVGCSRFLWFLIIFGVGIDHCLCLLAHWVLLGIRNMLVCLERRMDGWMNLWFSETGSVIDLYVMLNNLNLHLWWRTILDQNIVAALRSLQWRTSALGLVSAPVPRNSLSRSHDPANLRPLPYTVPTVYIQCIAIQPSNTPEYEVLYTLIARLNPFHDLSSAAILQLRPRLAFPFANSRGTALPLTGPRPVNTNKYQPRVLDLYAADQRNPNLSRYRPPSVGDSEADSAFLKTMCVSAQGIRDSDRATNKQGDIVPSKWITFFPFCFSNLAFDRNIFPPQLNWRPDRDLILGGPRSDSARFGLETWADKMREILVCLLLLVCLSSQQKDPAKDFCRRFGHQTAVVDQRLYIDGGLVNWNPISQNRNNYTNTWLVFHDLNSSPPSIEVPQIYANLSKNASLPSVSGAVLWQDNVNKRFYLFGGDYSDISPNTPNLISYDTLTNDWHELGPPNKPIQNIAYAGWVAISELGQGYILGGWLSNNSVPGWSGTPLATNSLVKFNMDTNDWSNNTGPADSIPRAEGVMVYVPASDDGLLIYFGGVTAPFNNGSILAAPMSLIHIYDIRSSKWYTQTAIGDVPASRRRFCAGVVWAPDQSSYNIYLYGGMGFGANYTGFDDVYILTMPSFRWIRWWESSNGGKPHHSLSCNVVRGGQMLIIGGTFPLNDDCDSQTVWGTHVLDLGKQSGKMWNDYSLNITSYVVPPEIISVVGGSSLGGATATAPAAGYDNRDLGVYFAQKASVAVRTPTRLLADATGGPKVTGPSVLSTGAIVGIAIGGLILLCAILLATCCLVHQRRKRRASPPPAEVAQNPVTTYSHVPLQSPTTPYSDQGDHPHHTQHYQLPANETAPPAELSGNNYQMHPVDPDKITMIPRVYDSPHNPPSPHYVSPSLSPHPSYNAAPDEISPHTGYGSQVSPTPTYSSLGRGGRKAVPANQTYYSP
ncbi:hypothetical protein VTL71DRAFT_11268 [Oculimacula yallundae]|uniref:Cell wall anchored protein n=1 Tax=Oculimacula yallundae TaxID=86028 RepID=A0ABR4CVS8_9HELO